MNNDTAASLTTFAVIAIALFWLMLLLTTAAPTSPVCLTKSEARHLWPRQHIYWYSRDHCWSNRRGGPPRGIRIDPVRAMAQESEKPRPKGGAVKTVRWNDYNEIDALADRDLFFEAQPFPLWRSLMTLDPYRFSTWHERIGDTFDTSMRRQP